MIKGNISIKRAVSISYITIFFLQSGQSSKYPFLAPYFLTFVSRYLAFFESIVTLTTKTKRIDNRHLHICKMFASKVKFCHEQSILKVLKILMK